MKNKPVIAILLALSICVTSVCPALAAESAAVETDETEATSEDVLSSEEAGASDAAFAESEGDTAPSEAAQDTEPAEDVSDETVSADLPQEQTVQNEAEMGEMPEEPGEDITSAEPDGEVAAPQEPEFTGEITIEGEEQSVTPGDSGKGDPNELFAEYVNEAFSTAGASKRKKSRRNTGSRLTGVEGAIYAGIASQLPAIASGERASTVFEFSAEEIGMQTTWTAQDLGVDAILEQTSSGGYVVTQEAKDAFAEKTKYNLDIIIDALLFDYPYELYWYEKTQRTHYRFRYTASSRRITITTMHIDFPVAAEFSAGEFTVDTSIGQSVQTAVANANAIVEEYSGASDEDKLYGFKNEICDLTSYNYDAINYNYEYGNPWQMIWVFDGDDTTKVVCEGYSKAFKYLCDRSTFSGSTSCLLVTGKINGGPHMWNIVRRADCYNYLVDVTNCDGSSIGAPDKLFLKRTDDITISDGIETGYIFHLPTRNIVYEYEDDTLDYYTQGELTLGAPQHTLNKTEAAAPTCTEDGNIDYWTCSKCGVVFSDAEGTVETTLPETMIPAIGHTWSEWVVIKEATTREEGTERRTCLNDESHTEERAIPKLVWKKDSKGWWLLRGDGSYPAGVFETVDGEIYYFDANGYMVTGWRLVDSKWYYFAASGVMQTGWKQIGGVWYYFDEDGVMQTGLQEIDGVWYYFKASGAMASGWQKISGVWYYFNAGGAMQTGWQRLDGVWYYFEDSGIMLTGWQELGGVWYYFNASGAMQTGWQRLGGVWYYFNAGGAMQTGWQRLGGAWYYFNASGAMQTGWQELDGAWYYFYESGDMAADTWIGDYYMGPDGKWVP